MRFFNSTIKPVLKRSFLYILFLISSFIWDYHTLYIVFYLLMFLSIVNALSIQKQNNENKDENEEDELPPLSLFLGGSVILTLYFLKLTALGIPVVISFFIAYLFYVLPLIYPQSYCNNWIWLFNIVKETRLGKLIYPFYVWVLITFLILSPELMVHPLAGFLIIYLFSTYSFVLNGFEGPRFFAKGDGNGYFDFILKDISKTAEKSFKAAKKENPKIVRNLILIGLGVFGGGLIVCEGLLIHAQIKAEIRAAENHTLTIESQKAADLRAAAAESRAAQIHELDIQMKKAAEARAEAAEARLKEKHQWEVELMKPKKGVEVDWSVLEKKNPWDLYISKGQPKSK